MLISSNFKKGHFSDFEKCCKLEVDRDDDDDGEGVEGVGMKLLNSRSSAQCFLLRHF